jgi:hypothetical protein
VVVVVVVVGEHPQDATQINLSSCFDICQRRLVFVLPPICLFGIAIVVLYY